MRDFLLDAFVVFFALILILLGVRVFAHKVQTEMANTYQREATLRYYEPAHVDDLATSTWTFGTDGQATLILDPDLPLAKLLRGAKRARITVEILAVEHPGLQKLER